MNTQRITTLQKTYGFIGAQAMINSGDGWKLEGSVGRHLMDLLEAGICMLPKKANFDYYGNRIPSRDDLKKGTKGTYQNCSNFWKKVESGQIDIVDGEIFYY